MADLECDFLIIGSGIAALRAALDLDVAGETLILTKGGAAQGSTAFAQGGIAAAVGAGDSPGLHAADTIAAGAGLCRAAAVQALTEQGPRYVRELLDWGARFDREPGGEAALAREGAHSVRRVLHARDATGREICRVLWKRIAGCARVRVIEHALAVDVDVNGARCTGARFLDDRGRLASVTAAATLLATGGAGQVFRETTNPSVAAGDGIAMAYRAGARVADLEFVQFHPTVLDVAGAPRFLLSEALRGEGAVLVNAAGERFMQRADPAGELAPRDRVARAIAREGQRTDGRVYLAMDHLEPAFVRARFPTIADACRRAGLDLARDRIPVCPAAHYIMGGVDVDLDGHTSVPGLLAAGEVACTGVHGANRLASNSLLEGLVFGAVAAGAMRRWAAEHGRPRSAPAAAAGGDRAPAAPAGLSERAARDLMWRDVGLFRDGPRLTRALETLDAWAAALEPAAPRARGRAAGQHRDGRTARCARRAAAGGEPRRPLPVRFSRTERYRLDAPRDGVERQGDSGRCRRSRTRS